MAETLSMVTEPETDGWWVMGNAEGDYLHWKGDGISGCYVPTCDPEDAERFDSKDEALKEIASDLVRKEFDGARGMVVPLKVTKTVQVFADL